MATVNTSDFDAVLKVHFGPGMQEQTNNSTVLLKHLDGLTYRWDGSEMRYPVVTARGQGISNPTETGSVAAADASVVKKATVTHKRIAARTSFSQDFLDSAKSDKGSFVQGSKDEMNRLTQLMSVELNRQCFGNKVASNTHTGPLTLITTGATSATQTVDDVSQLEVGMRIAIGTDAALLTDGGADFVTILSINRSAKTILVSSSITTVTDDILVRAESATAGANNLNKELTGLTYICQDEDDDLYGISTDPTTGSPSWKAVVIDASSNPLSGELVQEAVDALYDESGVEPDFILTSTKHRRQFTGELVGSIQQAPQATKAGFGPSLSFAGGTRPIPVLVDRHCPPGKAFLVSKAALRKAVKREPSWLDADDKILRNIAGTMTFDCVYVTFLDLACLRRNGMAVIENLDVT